MVRCGKCKGCRSLDCGQCRFCKDRPSNGGANKLKKACVNRKCTDIQNAVSPVMKEKKKSTPSISLAYKKTVGAALKQSAKRLEMKKLPLPKVSTKSETKNKDEPKVIQKELLGIKKLPPPKVSPKREVKVKEDPKFNKIENDSPRKESPRKKNTMSVQKAVQLPMVPSFLTMPKMEMLKFVPELIRLTVGQAWSSKPCRKPSWWPSVVQWVSTESKWNEVEFTRNQLVQLIRICYTNLGQKDRLDWTVKVKDASPEKPKNLESSHKPIIQGVKTTPVKCRPSLQARSPQSSAKNNSLSPANKTSKSDSKQSTPISRNRTPLSASDKTQNSGNKQSVLCKSGKTQKYNSPSVQSNTKQSPISTRSASSTGKNDETNRQGSKVQTPDTRGGKATLVLTKSSSVSSTKSQTKQLPNTPLKGQVIHKISGQSPRDKTGHVMSSTNKLTPPIYYGQPSPALSVQRMQVEGGKSGVPTMSLQHPAQSPYTLSADIAQTQPSPIKMTTFPKGLFFPFSAEIYICYFCEKEFLNKQKMRTHQKVCSERPPQLQQYQQLTIYTDHDTELNEPPQMSPQRKIIPKSSPLPLREFTNYLDLLPRQTAAKLRAHRASKEIDCELDELENALPVSPVTPRTPKSLISQLSREDAGVIAKKRLSYSHSLSAELKEDVDSSDGENDKDETIITKESKGFNLLNIPLSSLLGQRVKNFVHVESQTPVVENMESFCRTPVKNSFLEKLRKKDTFYNIVYKPLRRFNLHKQGHTYKFNKIQREAFLVKVNTGLNLTSYKKFKSLKRCKVDVERIARSQLLLWVSAPVLDVIMNRRKQHPRPLLRYLYHTGIDDKSRSERNKVLSAYESHRHLEPYCDQPSKCEFPSGPTLLSPNIDKLLGLKKKSSQTPQSPICNTLSIGNFISEEMEAEVSKQKLTLYRSLLYEMSVLKAAVVMEDIGGSEVDVRSKQAIRLNIQPATPTPTSDGAENKEIFVVKPRQSISSPVISIQAHSTPVISDKQSQFSKNNYKTLLTLLVPEKSGTSVEKTTKTLPAPYACQARKVEIKSSCDIHGSRESRYCDESKHKSLHDKSGTDELSVKVTSPSMTAVDKNLLSPDDAVSITSLSSDSDTPNPQCCIGCKVRSLTRSCSCGSAPRSPVPPLAQQHSDDSVMRPLNVAVVQDMYPTGLDPSDAMCGIPSPISNRSESPIPHTPTKPGLLSDNLDSDSDLVNLPREKLGCIDSPRSLRAKKRTSSEISQLQTVEKVTKEKTLPLSCSKLSFLRNSDRSKSLTPSTSPYKLDSPKSSSFPNSPAKAFTNPSMLCRTPTILSTKRAILCSSPSLRTRSKNSGSERKQGLFNTDSSEKMLTPVSTAKKNKDSQQTNSASDLGKVDVQPRRSKRRLSSFSMESPPHKMRKLSHLETASS